jgi:7,8-dihydro-6-hydroxymethylpterin dimethyltransferase
VPVPCCSPTCRSATYALYDGRDLVPLPRLVDVDEYLDYVTNRAMPDLGIRTALEGIFSASAAGGTERTGERLECVACGVGLPAELQEAAAEGFMVVVQDFQDPDGRLTPFCAYNSVGYREHVRAQLSAAARDGAA